MAPAGRAYGADGRAIGVYLVSHFHVTDHRSQNSPF